MLVNARIKSIIGGLAVYCGTVIGVGIFGLPYVGSRAGFIPLFLYLAFFGLYTVLSNLIYAEMVERTNGLHRLPGYAHLYLGKNFGILSTLSGIVGISLALLAYMVVGGGFLAELFSTFFGGSHVLYILIFFVLGSILVFFTGKTIARVEIGMLIFFFAIVIVLFFNSIPFLESKNFFTFDPKYIFLPYGVVLFSLGGTSIIPEVKDLLGKKFEHLLKPVLIYGSLIVVVTYILFIISVLGISGANTTEDAFTGVKNILNGATPIFLIFGILTTFTSFITLGVTVKKIFWYDMIFGHALSWALAMAFPLLLYAAGLTHFILIISVAGAVMGGIDNITFNLCYIKAKILGQKKPRFTLRVSTLAIYCIISLFILGIFIELAGLLNRII